ncbi:MAG TPA: sodium transporter [Lachnospiraceae bacterium]|nr:sodium transporter [Lachnospiraceae bacterium]
MKTLEKVSNFVGKWMALIVIAVAALSLFVPSSVSWIKTSWVNTLLGIVMFGMGLTLKPHDFAVVFQRPKDVVIGAVLQYTIMPLLAWVLCLAFRLPPELAVGVILVGTCPGGTSSNVMTYLSHGDVALSVSMTAVSTLLSPLLTPALTLLYAGQTVNVNFGAMMLSVVRVVLLPIVLGFVVNHFFGKYTDQAVKVLPLVSTTAIVMIIAAVVSANSDRIMTSGLLILAVVVCHNLLGYALGYGCAKLLRLDTSKCRAISIEVGMQNSGLATSLATTHFAQYPLATIPGAVFSVWHNISGALLASFFNHQTAKKEAAEKQQAAVAEKAHAQA